MKSRATAHAGTKPCRVVVVGDTCVSEELIEPFLENRDGIRWVNDLATEFPRIRILIASRQSERVYAGRTCARDVEMPACGLKEAP
jgi:hypothetical protein